MSNLQSDLQESIKKHLPQQIGEALAAELKELAALRVKDTASQTQITKLNNELVEQRNQISSLIKQLESHTDLATREAAVKERELRQEIHQVRLECAELRVKDLKGITETVF